MMNFAHNPTYVAALGMSTPLGLPAHTFPPNSLGSGSRDRMLPQRSPFAIQELLGLGNEDNERLRVSQAMISPYLSSSLEAHQGSGLKDSPSLAHYPSWRSSFLSALTSTAHSVLNLTSPVPKAEIKHGKTLFGEHSYFVLFFVCLFLFCFYVCFLEECDLFVSLFYFMQSPLIRFCFSALFDIDINNSRLTNLDLLTVGFTIWNRILIVLELCMC